MEGKPEVKIDFTINFRVDSPSSSNIRHAIMNIPEGKVEDQENKDIFLLRFCGEIANLCKNCSFYKNVQVMASFLERPIRIKYIVALPDNSCFLLDAALSETEIRKKAREIKDYFEIARENNASNLKMKYAILLTNDISNDTVQISHEYGIRIMTHKNAISFIIYILKNGQPPK